MSQKSSILNSFLKIKIFPAKNVDSGTRKKPMRIPDTEILTPRKRCHRFGFNGAASSESPTQWKLREDRRIRN
jgi:hypothetical protein